MMKHIPNLITSLNLASGFFAIIFALNGELVTASWLILAAMLFDFMDGFSARLLKAYSAIGKELDSLADVVSFGVAPGLIIYSMMSNALTSEAVFSSGSPFSSTRLLLLTPVIMPVCAALRLAIFNIDTTQATTFKGLPTPANALAVISIVIANNYSDSPQFITVTTSTVFLVILTLVLSLLMVSRIPLLSLKVSNLKPKGNEGRFILAGLIVIAFSVFGIQAAPLIIPLYLIASLLSLAF
jgi:CDP-diacylglycerol---serine O-phosphatidyltransferase